ncbi:AlpA family transcriptional regulator [Flavobacterium sp. 90]|uniref:helix-turn-helix domain-containing protein n=1 Tax=unclassified Flavobacterium TaxID=196869 RepID=UPI000EABE431|nr:MULTISPECIES: helix-turn-helix domain-containing protein [unclassified Flavobacterium]RKR05189.1 AlpA family transcriptional regulator [Flavobacterium sp. 81]TCK56504.1 AlpA family transcriptional regulator [Flavobacterium sp. 90]
MRHFTFDQLPEAVSQLYEKLDNIEKFLEHLSNESIHKEELMTISAASKMLNLSVSTIYSKVCRREIPVNKQGKQLYFYKSELQEWIKSGRVKTSLEIAKEVKFNPHSRLSP